MGVGRRGIGVLVAGAAMAGLLGLAAPAGAGDDSTSSDEGTQPEQGVTYSGQVSRFGVKLTAIVPTADGGTELLVRLSLACDDVGVVPYEEEMRGVVEPDGSFSIDVDIETPPEGGYQDVEIHLSGQFTGEKSTTARFSYDLYVEEDEGTVADSCEDSGDLELSGGRANRGLQRVEAGVPVEADDRENDFGEAVASADAVFVSLRPRNNTSADSTELFRIDPTTNLVTAHQTVPVALDALVTSGSSLFGVDADNGMLVPVDATSLVAGTPIQIAQPEPSQQKRVDFALYPAAASVDGGIWLSASRDQELVRVDAASGAVTARVPLDAHPIGIVAGPTGLYLETQTSPIFSDDVFTEPPRTNVVQRLDPATGAVLATSPNYDDGSIGAMVTTEDGVVFVVVSFGGGDDEIVRLEPTTLEVQAEGGYQSPVTGAPPGVWTNTNGKLRGLRPDLSRAIVVPDVVDTDVLEGAAGFGAIWIYNDAQQRVYRIATP